MTLITREQLARMAIETLWQLLHDPRLAGCTPYEAARRIGLKEGAARLVEKWWDGPAVFPGERG
ncbi:MAG TPA: hypothetical protein ENJ68_02780 [Devosia sp.]|nr:hypothetical protein [Devosia sp.]